MENGFFGGDEVTGVVAFVEDGLGVGVRVGGNEVESAGGSDEGERREEREEEGEVSWKKD